MSIHDFKSIKKTLSKQLEPKRYEHTIGVAHMAAALAMRYEVDMEKAYLAGLLHDCAKCISNSNNLKMCKKYNIRLSPAEERNPFLLHAKLGAYLAKKVYKIKKFCHFYVHFSLFG